VLLMALFCCCSGCIFQPVGRFLLVVHGVCACLGVFVVVGCGDLEITHLLCCLCGGGGGVSV